MPDSLQQSTVIVPDTFQMGMVGTDTLAVVQTEKPVKGQTEQLVVGVEGKPSAYNAGTDSVVSASVLMMIIVALLALAASWGFVVRQTRNFFYRENERTTNVPDSNKEIRSQVLLVAFTTFIFSVSYFAYFTHVNDVHDMAMSKNLLILLFVGVFVAYILIKVGLYQLVNWVFFHGKEIEQWNKSQLYVTTMEGLLMTPVALLFIYGKLPLTTALICGGFVVILCKLCTFYKSYLIFFRRFAAFLQIFLYFCALELIPLAALVGILEAYNGNSIINF